MKTNFLLSFFIGLLVPYGIYSQTGAAGVGSSSENIIWLDAHALSLSDGASVSLFSDVSGNGNNFSQASGDRMPLFSASEINGLPAVTFDGVNDYLDAGAISALESANITYFIVYERATFNDQSLINAGYTSESDKWGTYSTPANNRLNSKQKSPSNKIVYYIDGGTPSFLSAHYEPAQMRTYQQGTLEQTLNTAYTAGTGHNIVRLGGYTANPNFYILDGFIAEVVVYNTALNDLERILVENYLGAKYNMSIPSDFYSHQATHNIGLVGIGNDGTDSHTASQGAGILEISGATDLGPNEYLLAAHTDNAVPSDTTDADIPASIPDHVRFNRTWRADETGDVGTVTLTFHLDGTADFASSTSYRLLVDDDGNFSDAAVITGSYSSGDVTFTHDFGSNTFFTLAGLSQQLDIISVASTDWDLETTWDCGCIPTANDNVTILAGHTVDVDEAATANNLTINPGGTLAMSTADVDLELLGNFTVNGTLSLTDGEISMVGAGDQTISGNSASHTFHDIEINSNGEVTFEDATSFILDGTLSPNGGAMTIDPTATFIVNSTSATEGGRIGAADGGFNFTGDFVVRRFIPSGTAGYRDLCSPVIGATLTEWDAAMEISGPGFPDGEACDSEGCFNSCKTYIGTSFIDITDINEELVNGKGFYIWVGDDLSTWSGGTVEVSGPINSSADNVQSVSANWEIKGNPYASPILYSDVVRSGVGNYFYVYDVNISGYQWYDGSGAGSSSIPELTDGLLATGQAFWVNGPGTLTFSQASKTANTATYIRSTEDHYGTGFHLALSDETGTSKCIMGFEENMETNDGFDELIDIPHLTSELVLSPEIAVIADGELVRKNHIKKNFLNKSFDLYTKINSAGLYSISAENIEGFDSYRKVILIDKETGDQVDLKEVNQYVFHSEEGKFERFQLILTNSESAGESGLANITDAADQDISIVQMGHSIDIRTNFKLKGNVELSVINVLGQEEVYHINTELVEGSNIIDLPQDLKGVHIFTLRDAERTISKKLVF
ncbi:MAG: T9SS type A sorting domain-containing protein [Flavobacteriales bacterium]|nr:T9SS type A sorting domain-containing protein [Flavobacteriales bacterium]